ncbi:MAG: hypothetical protein FWE22_01295 [Firmicutes bacterium]|nr:hypothetical protein [Bacillota bacterium]
MKNKSRIMAILIALCLVFTVAFASACNDDPVSTTVWPDYVLVRRTGPDQPYQNQFVITMGNTGLAALRLEARVLPSEASQRISWEVIAPDTRHVSVTNDGRIEPQSPTPIDPSGNPVPARIRVRAHGTNVYETVHIIVEEQLRPPNDLTIVAEGNNFAINLSTGIFTLELEATTQTQAAQMNNLLWETFGYNAHLATVVTEGRTTIVTAGTEVGNVSIRVRVPGTNVYDVVSITITGTRPTPVQTVSIEGDAHQQIDLEIANTLTLTANVYPINASNMVAAWSSQNTAFLQVTSQTGIENGITTATITAVNGIALPATATIILTVTYGGMNGETRVVLGSVSANVTITIVAEDELEPNLPTLSGTWASNHFDIDGFGNITQQSDIDSMIEYLEYWFDYLYLTDQSNPFFLLLYEDIAFFGRDEAFELLALELMESELFFVGNTITLLVGGYLVNYDIFTLTQTGTAGVYNIFAGGTTEDYWIGYFNYIENQIRIKFFDGVWLVFE